MIKQFISFVIGLFKRSPVRLAIVRRYADANGAYVGELYMQGTFAGVSAYRMMGASLDTLPLDYSDNEHSGFTLDAEHDFLRLPMPPMTVRVGGLSPVDDIQVRREIFKLRHKPIELVVQNRFIEHVMERKA
jgi:hypothetical protein